MIKQGTNNIYEAKIKNSKNRVLIGVKERRFHIWLESTPFLMEETDYDKDLKNMEFQQEMSLEGGRNWPFWSQSGNSILPNLANGISWVKTIRSTSWGQRKESPERRAKESVCIDTTASKRRNIKSSWIAQWLEMIWVTL